ncbi:hypothetical protein [Legionella donaldsonii]|uniref:hypothetical protein n=1 Tax=Legionella donaldsonii TaxID=45060 RepID=UPI00399C7760
MATNRAVMFAMIQERDRMFLLHPGVTLEKFTSSLLHASASSPDILKVHLEKMATLEESQRLALLNEKYHGKTLLHAAARYPASLKLVLAAYSEEGRKEAVQEKDQELKTVLHLAVANPESLQIILDLYSPEELLEVVQAKTAQDDTTLHLAVPYVESFQQILAIYPPEKQLMALQQTNKDRLSVLQLILSYPKTLKTMLESHAHAIWSLQPKNGRETQGEMEPTMWHIAVKNPDALELLLQALPEAGRVQAVQGKLAGHNLLNWAQDNPNTLRVILRYLPELARLPLLLERGPTGSNILERLEMSSNFLSLAAILESFPEAAGWIGEAGGKTRWLPPFNTANNPARLMQQMLVLYDHIKQLKQCGMELSDAKGVGKQTIELADSLVLSLNQFIKAKKGLDVPAIAATQKEFCMKLGQGYKEMRTRSELVGAIILNIAIAATGIGFPFVLGKLFSTGSGFFMQTERQYRVSAIRDAFLTLEQNNDFRTALLTPGGGGM